LRDVVDLTERLRAWSYARQRLGEPAATLGAALRDVVAVYATHPTAPLALWARAGSFSADRYRRLDRDRRAVRIPAMRRTVFLVPARSAARVFAATRASPAHTLRPLRRLGVSDAGFRAEAERVLVAARRPAPARALEEATGIPGDRLAAVLRALRFEGRILAIAGESLLGSPHRYVTTTDWLPEGLGSEDPEDALGWLAGAYLRAYGQARIEDFAWWSGATARAAASAIERQATVDVGDGLLLPVGDRARFGRMPRLGASVAVLPRWDAYTMGYAPDGRRRLVHPDVQDRVYSPMGVGLPGDGNPVVLVDGEAVATWTFSRADGIGLQPFDTLGPRVGRRVRERLADVARLLSSGEVDARSGERA
jgi:hypothetical protein